MSCAGSARGFSLIELMVVVSIIIILVGLLVNGLIENKGPELLTKSTLSRLKSVSTEYYAATERWVNIGAPSGFGSATDRIQAFVQVTANRAETRLLLESLNESLVDPNNDGNLSDAFIVDGWENPIDYVLYNKDGDGGIATLPDRGSGKSPQPFFASAGQDGKWGKYRNSPSADETRQTQDNLFSFEIE